MPKNTETPPESEPVWVVSRARHLKYLSLPAAARPKRYTPGCDAEGKPIAIAVNDPMPVEPNECLLIAPGANDLDPAKAAACGVGHANAALDPVAMDDDLQLVAPWTCDEWTAVAVAAASCSRRALNRWRERETRPRVLEAIDLRLGKKPDALEKRHLNALDANAEVGR